MGPLDDTAFHGAVRDGTVAAGTLVWNPTLSDWRPWGEIGGAGPPGEAGSEDDGRVPCVECGTAHPLTEMLTFHGAPVCAGCKAVYFQRLAQGTPRAMGVAYGSFGQRFVAKVIDTVLLAVLFMPLQTLIMIWGVSGPMLAVVLSMGLALLAFVAQAAYGTYFLGAFGATPGKMALGLRVVVSDGSKVSYARACGRFFAEIASAMVLYIGYIMAAFDGERRTLHDHICNTRVIRW